MAVLTITAVPIQAQTGDATQLVLISGDNASGNDGADVINKVTRTMATMQECIEAGKAWVSMNDVGSVNGWRRYECFQRF